MECAAADFELSAGDSHFVLSEGERDRQIAYRRLRGGEKGRRKLPVQADIAAVDVAVGGQGNSPIDDTGQGRIQSVNVNGGRRDVKHAFQSFSEIERERNFGAAIAQCD